MSDKLCTESVYFDQYTASSQEHNVKVKILRRFITQLKFNYKVTSLPKCKSQLSFGQRFEL